MFILVLLYSTTYEFSVFYDIEVHKSKEKAVKSGEKWRKKDVGNHYSIYMEPFQED
jgi:hypothetical protein